MEDELMTQEELCDWLKITPVTAYRWRKAGMPYLGCRKALRYQKVAVINWLEQKKQTEALRK